MHWNAQFQNIVDDTLGTVARPQFHLVDVSELYIVVDVGLPHIVTQGGEYTVQRDTHQLYLVAVYIQKYCGTLAWYWLLTDASAG